eukprot:5854936-Pleurochrysis_carterae.AAC.1
MRRARPKRSRLNASAASVFLSGKASASRSMCTARATAASRLITRGGLGPASNSDRPAPGSTGGRISM